MAKLESIPVHVPLEDVFGEWQRQWLEAPELFTTEEEQKGEGPTEYGRAAAATFRRILRELTEARLRVLFDLQDDTGG